MQRFAPSLFSRETNWFKSFNTIDGEILNPVNHFNQLNPSKKTGRRLLHLPTGFMWWLFNKTLIFPNCLRLTDSKIVID